MIRLAYPQLLEDARIREIERSASRDGLAVRVKEIKRSGEVVLEALKPQYVRVNQRGKVDQ